MEANEFKTLKVALEILRKRLTDNVAQIKKGTRDGEDYIFSDETFQINKRLLKENQDNLMLQKHFSQFLTNYMFNVSFSEADYETDPDNAIIENQHTSKKEKTQEDYFLDIIEERESLENSIDRIFDNDILNNLLQYYLDDEQYEKCMIVQEQLNKAEKVS